MEVEGTSVLESESNEDDEEGTIENESKTISTLRGHRLKIWVVWLSSKLSFPWNKILNRVIAEAQANAIYVIEALSD